MVSYTLEITSCIGAGTSMKNAIINIPFHVIVSKRFQDHPNVTNVVFFCIRESKDDVVDSQAERLGEFWMRIEQNPDLRAWSACSDTDRFARK
jgi:hypothetical protein